MIPMPVCDIVDRFTILLLKVQHTPAGDALTERMAELLQYAVAIGTLPHYGDDAPLDTYIANLFKINQEIWNTENDIREGATVTRTSARTIAEAACRVRELNCTRSILKNRIAKHCGELGGDAKLNYLFGDTTIDQDLPVGDPPAGDSEKSPLHNMDPLEGVDEDENPQETP